MLTVLMTSISPHNLNTRLVFKSAAEQTKHTPAKLFLTMMSQAELQKAYGLVEALTSFSVSCCDSSSTSTRKRLLLTCNGDTSISLINNREKACLIILFRGVCILEACISNDNTMPKASCWLSTLSSAKSCH